MRIPYVIDNQTAVMADVLRAILSEHRGRSLDVATAYFTVTGFSILREGLQGLGNFRLLLGVEPASGEQLGLRPDASAVRGLLRRDLEALPFDEATLRSVEDLIAYLRRINMKVSLHQEGFLHAKCWLFYADRPGQQMLFDRFRPVLAIVGSSNFTAPGLTSNRELNLAHKVLLDPCEVDDREAEQAVAWLSDTRPSERISSENRQLLKSEVGARAIIELERWFEAQWSAARDFKDELIDLLDASKFGSKEYTPYQIYLKALYEYFKDELEERAPAPMRSAVELAEFQEDAVKKARRILARYDGVMVADSVGLGKTWIGKKLLEDFAYHMRQKAVVVCPASLRAMWERELAEASIAAAVISQEELGQKDFDPQPWNDADVLLVDESHNFRNRNAQRYGNLERVIGGNGGKGRDGARKKVLLLTATPINNDLLDLYQQLSLVTRGDRSYFTACGIGDLHRFFLQARREAWNNGGAFALFNLLEEVVIRRTRPFIRKAYPEATIRGQKIRFPERRLKTVRYDLENVYGGIYDDVVAGIESLQLAPYNLEAFKKAGVKVDEFEAGREQALVGIFKSRYLKRFESSIEAFRISVRRALEFLKTFEAYVLDGRLLRSTDFQKALRYLETENEEDDATPASRAEEMDASEEAKELLAQMETVDPSKYELRRMHEAVQHDVEVLNEIWGRIKNFGPEKDSKLAQLRSLLLGELRGQKVLVFTYFKDTARYLYRQLGHPDSPAAVRFRADAGGIQVRRMDSSVGPKERQRILQFFAPKANGRLDLQGSDKEIDTLICTDVFSEGQNLQDCGHLVNYDLHWNPTRMVQRAGRIDRLGTDFERLWIYNMFPDEGLERLLRLVESLSRKIAAIDKAGFLDASVLGETVHPKNFNTLRRICEEDGTVIEEAEQFTELASSEYLIQQLRSVLGSGGREMLEQLPDGIHSGHVRSGCRGVFFYFQSPAPEGGRLHFWKYVDLKEDRVVDNRFLVGSLIACHPDTPRVVDPELHQMVFSLQERAIQSILESLQQQRALEVAPRVLDPVQQTVATVIQSHLNHPSVNRKRALDLLRFLNEPMLTVQISALRGAYKDFERDSGITPLFDSVEELRGSYQPAAGPSVESTQAVPKLRREDLRLICFEFISGG